MTKAGLYFLLNRQEKYPFPASYPLAGSPKPSDVAKIIGETAHFMRVPIPRKNLCVFAFETEEVHTQFCAAVPGQPTHKSWKEVMIAVIDLDMAH